jgi:hypothetical protein
MKNKQLRAELADFPDDAEVMIQLDERGAAMESDLVVGWEGELGGMAKATAVYISDRVDDTYSGPFFDEQIRLGLPNEFIALCNEVRMTPAAVLHGFIADLCRLRRTDGPRDDGLVSNGSDERMLALQYFERCGYHHRD